MKKIALLFVGICGMTAMVSAQTITNTRLLNENASRLKLVNLANYAKALAMAKEKGWMIRTVSKGGRVVQLIGVDEGGYPKYYITDNNTTAAATTRASQLWPGGGSGLNLSGNSANMKNKLGIWDGGNVLGTHVEMTGRITQKDNSAVDDHATHVAGTMIATGVNPAAKGMAFGIQGMIAYEFTNDISEMNTEAAAGLLLSNHSYSRIAGWYFDDNQSRWEFRGRSGETQDYKFGYYGDESAQLDDLTYNAPFYLVVKSAGNVRVSNGPAVGEPYFRYNTSGQMVSAGSRPTNISDNDTYDVISLDVGAKNILTVGAVNPLPTGYSRKEDVQMTTFSAWGPTDDGRIKPDIVADGVNLLSSVSTSNTAYSLFSGTSMAAPNSTGSLLLLQEYYSKLKAGAFLRSATLKGLAIHTAEESGANDGPDYQFGWGLLNVEKAAAVITAAVPSNNAATATSRLYETSVAQGGSFSITVVASGRGKLQATISWTDVKGVVVATNTDPLALNNRAKNLVNDLDIRITKGARTYLPWTLDVNNPSNAAKRGDNNTDNVERIDIDSTVPGQTYVITVTHKGTLQRGPQAFSLLVSGVGGTAYCASASGGGGARIDSVSFRNVQLQNSAGSKTYTDNTAYVANVEPGQTVPIAIRVNTADATTASRIVKVFIDYNNNGTFETGELVANSATLTAASQIFTANIAVPSTVAVGNIGLMRIIVQETSTLSDINACGTYAKGETQDYIVRVVSPSNDMTVNNVTAPMSNECGTPTQYLQISLRNNGSVSQTNIPVTISIATGGTVLGTYTFTHPGPISPLTNVPYTFQTPIATTGGTAYTITATVNQASDQYSANNTLVTSITTAPKPVAPTAIASNCGLSTVFLKVTNPVTDASYFWFGTASGTSPLASGVTTSLTTRTTNNTYYVQREIKVGVGPANKQVYTSGGYNIFRGNYVKINNQVPVVIESARLYIGYPGTVKVTLADLLSEDANGSFSYLPIASNTIDVYATTPNVLPGAVTANSALDTGAIFRLDLPVTTTGDHILIVECNASQGRTDSATIFRNNLIAGTTTYPMTIPNVFSITGNSAHTGGSVESAFYYFFYDMKVASLDCVSDRVAITAVTPSVSISKTGAVLTGTTTNVTAPVLLQWYFAGNLVPGATAASYTPTASGKVKLVVTDAFNCQTSAEYDYSITAAIDVTAREIKLNVSPNPSNGIFNLSFEVTTKADLLIEIVGASGKKVFSSSQSNFVGKYSKQIRVPELSSDFYILKIQHDKKTYVQKLLIQR